MDNYIWKYESDKQSFNKFKLDLSILLDHKLVHCAPIHEEHWADELVKELCYCFTGKTIVRIAGKLNDYIERMGYNK